MKQLAGAEREVTVVFEMAWQRDGAFQFGCLPPVVGVGVNAGGRRPQAGEQTRARRIATRRGTVSLGEEQAAPGQARWFACDVKKTHAASGRDSIGTAARPQSYSPCQALWRAFWHHCCFCFF